MTSSVMSGSTRWGDTQADDTHFFTGSLFITGSGTDITNTMTASLASVKLQHAGHLSGSLGTIKGFNSITGTTITGTSGSFGTNLGVGTTTPAESLEVIGSVSASASGSFLNVDVTDNIGIAGKLTLPNISDVSASIASAVAGGDDMGNHTATQDLDMDGNDIFDVGHISGSGNISGSYGNILGYKSGSFAYLNTDSNISASGDVSANNLFGQVKTAAQTNITSLLATDIKIGEDDQTKIDFGTANQIQFAADNQFQMKLTDGVFQPVSDSDVDLGATGVRWKDAFVDSITTTDSGSFAHVAVTGEGGQISGSKSTLIGFASADITSGSFSYLDIEGDLTASKLYGTVGTATQATINHDSLSGFVANEHIDHSSVSVTAGTGMTGGGTIASTRTLNVVGGTGVTANANDIAIGQDVATTANVQFNHISASGNISGSAGDILGFDSLSVVSSGSFGTNLGVGTTTPAESLEVIGSVSASASGSFLNVKATNNVNATNLYGTVLTATQATIDHDSLANFVANEHIDHSSVSVTAGDGLTGGGTIAANRTINVVGGDGITANANDIAITAAQTTVTSVLAADLKIGEDDETKIDFETANEIHFYADNTEQVYLGDNIFGPESDSDVDLGSNSVRWKDAYVDSVVSTGSGSFAHVAITGEGGQISGSQSTLIGFKNSTITSGSFDYVNVTGNVTASSIETSGDIVAFGSSDRELKDNIQPIENPLEKIKEIGGYTFVWNDKQSTYKGKDVGVVAQEIQSVLPEIVASRANGYLGVKYEKIVPLLIESIKELQEKIEKIEQKCDCLNK